jgi:dolichol kinase
MPTGRAYLLRRALHVALSILAAVVLWALPSTAAASALAGATLLALSVELARRTVRRGAVWFQRAFGSMLKEQEASRLTGATTLAVGFTVAAVVTPGVPALAGVLIAGIGDPVAALAGRRWGRVRFAGGKSVVGSAAFWVVTVGVSLALGLGLLASVLVGIVVAVTEAATLPVDDNAYLPVAGAAAFLAARWLAGL